MLRPKDLLILPLLMLTASTAAKDEGDWIARSNQYAVRVLEASAEFSPESASRQGLSTYDGEIFDISPGYRERYSTLQEKLVGELREALAREEQLKVRQDLQILIRDLQESIERRALTARHLLPYYDLHQTLFYHMRGILDPRLDPERHGAVLSRLAKYTGRAPGYEPVTEQAKARTREAFSNAALLGPYRAELENDLKTADRLTAGIRELLEKSTVEGWEDDLALLEKQLADYRDWLERELLPRAREDNLLPAEIYASNLNAYGVRATPEQLMAEGKAAYQSIRNEMKALAVRIAERREWSDSNLVAVMKRLKAEQLDPDTLLDTYKARLAALEQIIRDEELLTLPDRAASIRLATPAESASAPAPFMSPPQLINNDGQYGEFVLVQENPNLDEDTFMDDWSHDAITWALTAHEARPGHELQYARLVEDGTSIARALYAFNSANVEGWGLYAESIVHPYLSEEAQLFSLFSRLVRAARMFLDPMVNTGQLSPEEVSKFLQDQTALSLPMAESEAARYAFRAPGQATSYFYGYTKMLTLRTELELRLGDRFKDAEFHDFVLRQGLVPPELLREAALEHFIE